MSDRPKEVASMKNSAGPKIRMVDVHKSFGQKTVLDGVTVDVATGESLVIIGGSGSGKSVTIKCVLGLLHPDSGSIQIDGRETTHMRGRGRDELMLKFGMLFQGGALFDSMTVRENVAYPLRLQNGLDEQEIRARVRDRLALVGLAGIEELTPGELSGGMRKRVALARAIAASPDLILYDEPTAGLDPLSARHIDELIRSLQHRLGVTSLVVTHDLVSACSISDRIALLRDGRIGTVLTTGDFLASDLPEIRELRAATTLVPPAAARAREAGAERTREEAADAC